MYLIVLVYSPQNSSSCHKIIVVMSDGRINVDVDSFTDSNVGGKVRVFSYVIGILGEEEPLKTLACRNRGEGDPLIMKLNNIYIYIYIYIYYSKINPFFTTLSLSYTPQVL